MEAARAASTAAAEFFDDAANQRSIHDVGGRRDEHMVSLHPVDSAAHGINQQAARHRLRLTRAFSFLSGSKGDFVPRSATCSMAWKRPRPRMSPIHAHDRRNGPGAPPSAPRPGGGHWRADRRAPDHLLHSERRRAG